MTAIRKRRRKVAEINVVPYIDVMLVLLIIFMVTAPLITQGVNVELPAADAEPLEKDSDDPLVATVDVDGNFYLNKIDAPKQALTEKEFMIEATAYRELHPNAPVVVKGDKDVRYEEVIRVMAMLQASGFPAVGLMTESLGG